MEGAGTIYIKKYDEAYGSLIVDNMDNSTNVPSTVLSSIGSGTISSISGDTLIDTTRSFTPSSLIGLYIKPRKDDIHIFEVRDNGIDNIEVITEIENPTLLDAASVGDTYHGYLVLKSLELKGSASLITDDVILITDNTQMNIESCELNCSSLEAANLLELNIFQSFISAGDIIGGDNLAINISGGAIMVSDTVSEISCMSMMLENVYVFSSQNPTTLEITADDIFIDSDSSIDLYGAGLPGARNVNNESNDYGLAISHLDGSITIGSTGSAGGSFGGLGTVESTGTPNAKYGSTTDVTYPGSGGGVISSDPEAMGGNGGGLIILNVMNNLEINGYLDVSGAYPENANSGGGSAGGVYINIPNGTFTGNGEILAVGNYDPQGGGAGGGGRVLVDYSCMSDRISINVSPSPDPGNPGTSYTTQVTSCDYDNFDSDGDGFTPNQDDCDDSDRFINPMASEICGNSIDDNCDSEIDELDCIDQVTSPFAGESVCVGPQYNPQPGWWTDDPDCEFSTCEFCGEIDTDYCEDGDCDCWWAEEGASECE